MRRVVLPSLTFFALATMALMLAVIGLDTDTTSATELDTPRHAAHASAGHSSQTTTSQPRFLSFSPGLAGRAPKADRPQKRLRVRHQTLAPQASHRGVAVRPPGEPITFPPVHIRARRRHWRNSYRRSRGYRAHNGYYSSFNRQRYLDYLRSRRAARNARFGSHASRADSSSVPSTGSALSPGSAMSGAAPASLAGLSPQLAALLNQTSASSAQATVAGSAAGVATANEALSVAAETSDSEGTPDLITAIDGLMAALDPAARERTHAGRALTEGVAQAMRADLSRLRADQATATCFGTPCLRQLATQLQAATDALTGSSSDSSTEKSANTVARRPDGSDGSDLAV